MQRSGEEKTGVVISQSFVKKIHELIFQHVCRGESDAEGFERIIGSYDVLCGRRFHGIVMVTFGDEDSGPVSSLSVIVDGGNRQTMMKGQTFETAHDWDGMTVRIRSLFDSGIAVPGETTDSVFIPDGSPRRIVFLEGCEFLLDAPCGPHNDPRYVGFSDGSILLHLDLHGHSAELSSDGMCTEARTIRALRDSIRGFVDGS